MLLLSTFFYSCNKQFQSENTQNKLEQLSFEEKENLTTFFNEFLFNHAGAYTLFGNCKSVTIEPLLHYDFEDFRKIDEYIKNHPKLKVIKVERKLEETWKDWKKLSDKFEIKNYILTELKFSEKESLLIFLNIKNTIKVLEQYYDDFKRVTKEDFNPIDVISRIKNKDDDFWKKIFKNHALVGILLGYGYDNASLFNLFMTNDDLYLKNLHQNSKPSEDSRKKSKYYINNIPFRLPIFVCLNKKQSDELIKKYSDERKKILKLYKNKDFLSVTIEKLTSS